MSNQYKLYKDQNRRLTNKKRKIAIHIKVHLKDLQSMRRLSEL